MAKRDYSLLGFSGRLAVKRGLAQAKWYQTSIPKQHIQALVHRSDDVAYRDTLILLGIMFLSIAGGIYYWNTTWCVPFWLVYGLMYGSAMDARWHECVHGTAFRTTWMNQALFQVASFMMIRNPVVSHWSHARHHSDTMIVGRDPEIVATRPPELFAIFLNVFGILDALKGWKSMILNAAGILGKEEASFIPKSEQRKVSRVAGLWAIIYALTFLLAVAFESVIPFMIVGLPRLYGAWHQAIVGLLQHAGLAENVVDHRLNTRTVYLNPVSRFICWNNNYHMEHHMFPSVPFHQLPRLHKLIKHDVPAADTSIWKAYGRVLPILLHQKNNPNLFLRRKLPSTAKPYVTKFLG